MANAQTLAGRPVEPAGLPAGSTALGPSMQAAPEEID